MIIWTLVFGGDDDDVLVGVAIEVNVTWGWFIFNISFRVLSFLFSSFLIGTFGVRNPWFFDPYPRTQNA
jgi:hypothetical protein